MLCALRHSRPPFRSVNRGFTLIEVMITVAIIGILSAIALPMYSDYIRRGRIPEAISNLAGTQVRLEQYFQDAKSYLNGTACGVAAPVAGKYFNFSYTVCNATAYTLQASGYGSMAGFNYTIDQDGNKATLTGLPSGWTPPSPNNCWVTNKGGAC
jgi:type IV pilus assembly protein PilE